MLPWQQTRELLKTFNKILHLEQKVGTKSDQVPAQLRRDLAARRLDLATTLVQDAAADLKIVYAPSYVSELLVIADRLQRIKAIRTLDLETDAPKNASEVSQSG